MQKHFVGMEVLHFVEVEQINGLGGIEVLGMPMITLLHSCLDAHPFGIQSHATMSK